MRLRIIFYSFLLFLFCSNNSLDSIENELHKAESKWFAVSTGNYTFVLKNTCDCGVDYCGPFKVMVRNEMIDSMFNKTTNLAIPESLFINFRSIAQSFKYIDSINRNKNQKVSVEYDQIMGYPKKAKFDYHPGAMDAWELIEIDSVFIE